MIAGVGAALIAMRLIIPCPIQGNWVGWLTAHLCTDHAFMRFSDGHMLFYHGDLDPRFFGIVERTGWNAYTLRYYRGSTNVSTIQVGWLFLRTTGDMGDNWLHRDFHIFEGHRIVHAAETNARLAKDHLRLLKPGMPGPEVWAALQLPDWRTPKRDSYRTQDVWRTHYLLSPDNILYCEWALTNTPATLLKAEWMGWPDDCK